jgi:hypothetical protein
MHGRHEFRMDRLEIFSHAGGFVGAQDGFAVKGEFLSQLNLSSKE